MGVHRAQPVLRAEPPEAVRPRVRVWTPSEVGRFLEHVRDNRWFSAWLTLASTGMRRGEVLGLRWGDVELDPKLGSPRLSVRQTLLAVKNEVSASTPKTERSARSIPLDAHLVTVLKRWRAQQAGERLAAGPDWSDVYGGLVFTHPDGRHIHPDRFSDWFHTHVRRAGLPKVRLHDLRHGWATYALEAGVAPRIVTEQQGHSSVAFTQDSYTRVLEKVHTEAVERVARLVQGG